MFILTPVPSASGLIVRRSGEGLWPEALTYFDILESRDEPASVGVAQYKSLMPRAKRTRRWTALLISQMKKGV
ncbi:hypothetical protein OU682_22110 [Paracoccus sp. EF6]|uniref:Uncharacterized protein n=1 Tax=Paracoccus benzoatiresistens TaxID=2997341 RepID=A0ABT4JB30_9RHOB|nr:hypothetical protein [Paracoccus sp. EF6]